MSRAGLALGGALAVSLAALARCGSRGEEHPRYDVVLVSIDTLRADRLNAYGYGDRVVSQQLDALARDGLLFETHVSASWIGRFLQALKRGGLYDRSLIVVTSDHGEQLGEKPGEEGGKKRDGRFYNAHGHTLYEEMLRVPLIVKLPGQHRAGTRIRQLSRAIDVMPTILDVLGVEVEVGRLQGTSLRPLWEGGAESGRARPSFTTSRRTPRSGTISWPLQPRTDCGRPGSWRPSCAAGSRSGAAGPSARSSLRRPWKASRPWAMSSRAPEKETHA